MKSCRPATPCLGENGRGAWRLLPDPCAHPHRRRIRRQLCDVLVIVSVTGAIFLLVWPFVLLSWLVFL